jgi:hypothetical protein
MARLVSRVIGLEALSLTIGALWPARRSSLSAVTARPSLGSDGQLRSIGGTFPLAHFFLAAALAHEDRAAEARARRRRALHSIWHSRSAIPRWRTQRQSDLFWRSASAFMRVCARQVPDGLKRISTLEPGLLHQAQKSAFDAVEGSSTGTRVPRVWVLLRPHDSKEPLMQTITTPVSTSLSQSFRSTVSTRKAF